MLVLPAPISPTKATVFPGRGAGAVMPGPVASLKRRGGADTLVAKKP